MDEGGNTKDDLGLPKGTDDAEKLADQIKKDFDDGKELVVTVLKVSNPPCQQSLVLGHALPPFCTHFLLAVRVRGRSVAGLAWFGYAKCHNGKAEGLSHACRPWVRRWYLQSRLQLALDRYLDSLQHLYPAGVGVLSASQLC